MVQEAEEVHHLEVLVQEGEVDQEHGRLEVVEAAVPQELYHQEVVVAVGLLHALEEVVAVGLLEEVVAVGLCHASEEVVEVEHPLVEAVVPEI